MIVFQLDSHSSKSSREIKGRLVVGCDRDQRVASHIQALEGDHHGKSRDVGERRYDFSIHLQVGTAAMFAITLEMIGDEMGARRDRRFRPHHVMGAGVVVVMHQVA